MNPAEHMSLVVETENASEEGATGPMIRPEDDDCFGTGWKRGFQDFETEKTYGWVVGEQREIAGLKCGSAALI